jgi:hypothetical protein
MVREHGPGATPAASGRLIDNTAPLIRVWEQAWKRSPLALRAQSGMARALAPNLVTAAIEGRLPRGIGVERLRDPPTEWSRQFEAFGLNPE